MMIVMLHAARQLPAWLIFVRAKYLVAMTKEDRKRSTLT